MTEYEVDIESDLSAFHRIDDPMTLDGPRYFRLALRLAAYAGVIAARVYAESKDDGNGASEARSAAPAASAPTGRSYVSDDAAIAMLSDGWAEHIIEGQGE